MSPPRRTLLRVWTNQVYHTFPDALTGSNLINAKRTHGPPAAGSPPNGPNPQLTNPQQLAAGLQQMQYR